MMKKWIYGAGVLIGVALMLLGLLWFLQGADLLHIEPIACVADCEPIEGPSTTWLLAGVVAVIVGVIATTGCIRRLNRS